MAVPMTIMDRFRDDMGRLGGHPDKDTIVRLTNLASQHQELANDIVELVQGRVLSSKTPPAYRLPLCYLMDSILQNVRGVYIILFGRYAVAMCCRTYEEGSPRDRQCIAKLLRLWRERSIFDYNVLDPIDAHIQRIDKALSAAAASRSVSSSSNGHYSSSSGVGEKRKLPPSPSLQPQLPPPSSSHHYPPTAPSSSRSPPGGRRRSRSRSHSPPSSRRGAGGSPVRKDPRRHPPPPSSSSSSSLARSPPQASDTHTQQQKTKQPVKRSLDFIVAVDKEMKTMLDGMVREMGAQKMTIEELARRNPTAAEQLKRAAEAAVVTRMQEEQQTALDAMDAIGPFALPGTGRELLVQGGEVAQRIQKLVLEPPTSAKPGLIDAARDTASQLLGMMNILMQQQGMPPIAGGVSGPTSVLGAPLPPPGQVPQQQQQPQQLALQALAQQLAGALIQQQQQQQQQQQPPPLPQPLHHHQHHHQQQQAHPHIHPHPQPPLPPHQQQQQQGANAGAYMVQRLYTGEQSKEDGLRFPNTHTLTQHQAWLGKVREIAAAVKAKGKVGGMSVCGLQSRAWYSTVNEWVKEKKPYVRVGVIAAKISKMGLGGGEGGGGGGGGGNEDLTHCVPMDDAQSACKLCGEPFDQFWEGKSAQWMYRNAVRVQVAGEECVVVEGTGKGAGGAAVVHWLCFEASDKKAAAKMLAPVPS